MTLHAPRIPHALSIAGVDPSGGAGIFADLKTFSALGAYGCGVVTALTAQNTVAVTGVQGVPPAFIRQQLDTLFDDVRIDALKIGMLGNTSIVRAVADGLASRTGSVAHRVLDPVMVAKSGDALLEDDAVAMLVEAILPLATVMTPNLPEAGVLLKQRPPETPSELRRAAERLRRMMSDRAHCWVLLKGGHLNGDPLDLLHDGDRMIEMPARRIETRNTHGTGCTLSSAIAALLPQRVDVPTAVREARDWLLRAIAAADQLQVGTSDKGHGPVHHFHAIWPMPNARRD